MLLLPFPSPLGPPISVTMLLCMFLVVFLLYPRCPLASGAASTALGIVRDGSLSELPVPCTSLVRFSISCYSSCLSLLSSFLSFFVLARLLLLSLFLLRCAGNCGTSSSSIWLVPLSLGGRPCSEEPALVSCGDPVRVPPQAMPWVCGLRTHEQIFLQRTPGRYVL